MTPPKDIIAMCVEAFDVCPEEFARRTKTSVWCRAAAAWLIRRHRPDMSFPDISEAMGGRRTSHSTIIDHVARVRDLLATGGVTDEGTHAQETIERLDRELGTPDEPAGPRKSKMRQIIAQKCVEARERRLARIEAVAERRRANQRARTW